MRKAEIREEEEADLKHGKMAEQRLLTEILDLSYADKKQHRERSKLFGSNNQKDKNDEDEDEHAIESSFRNGGYSDGSNSGIDKKSLTASAAAAAGSSDRIKATGSQVKSLATATESTITTTSAAGGGDNKGGKSRSTTGIPKPFTSKQRQQQLAEQTATATTKAISTIHENDDNDDDEDDDDEEEDDDDDMGRYIKNQVFADSRATVDTGGDRNSALPATAPVTASKDSKSGNVTGRAYNDNIKLAYNRILDYDDDDEDEDDYGSSSGRGTGSNGGSSSGGGYKANAHTSAVRAVSDRDSSKRENSTPAAADEDSDDDLTALVRGILSTDSGTGADAAGESGGGSGEMPLKTMYARIKLMIDMQDYNGAESLLYRAIELDPLDIRTLNKFAVFLHKKRGELARAEAFFLRGVQVCLPGFVDRCRVALAAAPVSATAQSAAETDTTAAADTHSSAVSVSPFSAQSMTHTQAESYSKQQGESTTNLHKDSNTNAVTADESPRTLVRSQSNRDVTSTPEKQQLQEQLQALEKRKRSSLPNVLSGGPPGSAPEGVHV